MNKKLVAVLILLIFLLVWKFCPSPQPPPVVIVECPHDWRWDEKQKAVVESFTGGRDNVPEFNDCQKFLVGSETAPEYDSLFAIFASGSLDTLHARPVPTAAAERSGRASALIRAWGSYGPLGIEPGFNCLVLRSDADSWRGYIVPAKGDGDCNGDLVVAGSTPLSVVREPLDLTAFEAGSVPPVARWGFDRRTWSQYIIIKCGDATCYVGAPGFSQQRLGSVMAAIGTPLGGNAVYRIAGWHDAQFLAERPTGGDIRPVNPPLFGAVIPDALLGQRTHTDYREGWVRVAEVALSAHSDQYADKANFGATTSAKLNTIDACVDAGRCAGLPNMNSTCKDADDLSGEQWRTRHINAVTSDTTYHCVEYRALDSADSGLTVPGTARWRWLADDETLWFRCPNGCCKVQE